MAEFLWYRTSVSTTGVALSDSVEVTVWFGPSPPPPGSGPYEFVIIDSDADGLISPAEWQNATGGGGGGNLGGAFALFDFTPPQRGNLYTAVAYQQGDSGLLDGLTQNFAPVDPDFLVICFATGTLIDTPGGFRAVETLASGDLVLTLDHGPQPVRAVWRGDRPGIGPYAPVHIAAGTLCATRDLRVSQNHRLLLRHPQAELHFGAPEVLVMAKSLVGAVGVRMETLPSVSYVHLFLDRHEIVRASGVLSETVLPVSWLGGRHRALSDAALFGAEPGETGSACRPLLTDAEGPAPGPPRVAPGGGGCSEPLPEHGHRGRLKARARARRRPYGTHTRSIRFPDGPGRALTSLKARASVMAYPCPGPSGRPPCPTTSPR